MLSQIRTSILISSASLLLTVISGKGMAQEKFDSKLLKNEKYTLACYAVNGSNESAIGTFTIGINAANDKLALTTITALTGLEEWKDTAISNLSNFKPIYRASHSTMKDMVLHFGSNVTGYYVDKKTGKKTQIQEAGNQSFIDSYTYPFILSLLPLTSGYSTDLSVYEYKPTNSDNLKKAIVEEVKNSTWVSKYTGKHDVWEVTVLEPSTDEKSVSYIDKKTRRLWQVDAWSNGQQIRMVDMETDFNSVKSPFDKEATMKMVKGGNSITNGQVFARDFNDNGQWHVPGYICQYR